MKKTLFAAAAALLLTLPACVHGPRGHHRGPGGPCCQKHQGCDCTCRQGPDAQKPCPDRPNCPQAQQAPAPCPNCPQQAPPQK